MNFKITNTLLALCLAASASFGLVTSTAHAALIDEGTGSGLQCGGNSIDDSGREVGTCTDAIGVSNAFVAVTAGTEQTLSPLVSGRNCSAGRIVNSGAIIGSCQDTNTASQAVVWSATNPGGSATKLPPLLGQVRSAATAINQNGIVVGMSVDDNDTTTPVIWLTNTAATVLPVGLLGLASTNCSPTDVSDTSGSASPIVVGNCPNGQGTATPVIWTKGVLGYAAALLALPSGAISCGVSEVNIVGQAMGSCEFASAFDPKTVRWSAAGVPQVLATVAGSTARNVGADMNASGQIAGVYLTSADFGQPFFWDPATGNNATAIAAIAGGNRAGVVGIGNNGTVTGNSEVSSGNTHPFTWTASGGTVDQGTLGGTNAAVSGMSPSGHELSGSSEVPGEKVHATRDDI